MAKKEVNIVWSKSASRHFLEILEFLSLHSEQATSIIGNAILNEIDFLAKTPMSHPEDRFKKRNDGTFRACVIFSYRISYKIDGTTIKIVRIRHTSRQPLEF